MAGRHRKPTHTGRNLAAVTASGAFLLPLGGGVADARVPAPDPEPVTRTVDPQPRRVAVAERTGIDWSVIARCESGNRNINNTGYPRFTASGYYQITDPTWRANGGTQFASRAIGASRAEQLIVAQRIAARRGSLADWNASRGCWDGKTGTTPGRAAESPTPQRSAPRVGDSTPSPSGRGVTGRRAADGTGSYVCTTDKLSFDACDPDTLGTVQQYPAYSGRHRTAASTTAAVRPVAAATPAAAPASTSGVVRTALGWLGTPYRYGGTGRSGIDCSALVQNVLRAHGVTAPRTSRAQHAWATPISASEARPGDLVFFYTPVSHVGIYLGDGRMVDAPRPGMTVAVRNVYPGAKYGRVPS